MNILYIADPNSHDIRWIEHIAPEHNCFLLLRSIHYKTYTTNSIHEIEETYKIKIAGGIDDFSIAGILKTFRTINFISKCIKTYHIDILHIMYAEPNALWALFRKQWRVPVVITTRGTDILKTIPVFFNSKQYWQKLIARLYTLAVNRADLVTCTSYDQMQKVIGLFKYPEHKIQIIRTGVEYGKIRQFAGTQLPKEVEAGGYVFFPRYMRPLYNHEFSIGAIGKLDARIRKWFKFVFLDKNSSDKAYVEHIEGMMRSIKDCHFVFLEKQAQHQIFSLYQNAALIVMNPISDGTPVSALEAFAFQKQVILGPLNYDEDLFEGYELKLSSWSESELAEKMEKALAGIIKVDMSKMLESIYEKTDRESQMQIVKAAYKKLKAGI